MWEGPECPESASSAGTRRGSRIETKSAREFLRERFESSL